MDIMAAFVKALDKKSKGQNGKLQRLEDLKKEVKTLEKDIESDTDFNTMRTELAMAVSKHFKSQLFEDFLPFYGVAPLFGLNPQIGYPVDVREIEGLGKTMVTMEQSRSVKEFALATVMLGIWRGMVYLTEDHPGFTEGVVETMAKVLEDDSMESKFPEWMTRESGYVLEYRRRQKARSEVNNWKLLTDFMMNGTCATTKGDLKLKSVLMIFPGHCDKCGIVLGWISADPVHCQTCHLATFCSTQVG